MIIYSILFLIISFLLIIQSTLFWYFTKKKCRNKLLVDLIYYFISIKLLLYYVMPAILRIFSEYQFEIEDKVEIGNLFKVYVIELFSWFIWLSVFYLITTILNKRALISENINNKKQNDRVSKQILFITSIGFILWNILVVFKIDLPFYFELFKSLFFYVGLASGPFLLIYSKKYLNKKYFFLGLITTLTSLLFISTRGALIYTLLFIYFIVFYILESKKAKKNLILFSSIIIVGYFIFGGLFTTRIFLDEAGSLKIDSGVDLEKKGERSSLDEIEWRFGAQTRYGTAFISLYERGQSAGISPIRNSLAGFLPRSINPEKPIPNSLDKDDIYSQGMYIIYREINGYNTSSMSEFPTGAHFYWEFGYLGVIILSLISGIYVAVTTSFFAKLGIAAVPLTISIFKPWGFVEPKIWVSDIALQSYQIILPLFLLLGILKFYNFLTVTLKKTKIIVQ